MATANSGFYAKDEAAGPGPPLLLTQVCSPHPGPAAPPAPCLLWEPAALHSLLQRLLAPGSRVIAPCQCLRAACPPARRGAGCPPQGAPGSIPCPLLPALGNREGPCLTENTQLYVNTLPLIGVGCTHSPWAVLNVLKSLGGKMQTLGSIRLI